MLFLFVLLKFHRVGICWVYFTRLRCYFHVIMFFLSTSDSHGTLHLTFGLVTIPSAAPFT